MSLNLYPFGKSVVKAILTPLYRIQIIGKEKFPTDGGVLICANHIDNLDPPVVGLTCPRDIHFMAKEELFHAPVLKQLLPTINVFPVKRGMSDKKAIRTGLTHFERRKGTWAYFQKGQEVKPERLVKD